MSFVCGGLFSDLNLFNGLKLSDTELDGQIYGKLFRMYLADVRRAEP